VTARIEWSARLVALTVFGAAAIVPALLARRTHDANGTLAEAELLRANVDRSELSRSGAGGNLESPGVGPSAALALEAAFLAPAPAAPPSSVRFFSTHEIDQATTRVANRPAPSSLLPPLGLSSSVTADGVLLTWTDNPGNPVGSIVKTQVVRWVGHETPKQIFESPPAPVPAGESGDAMALQHRHLDAGPCPGSRASYAVLTVQLDKIEGIEVRRSILGETVTAEVPVRYRIEPRAFVPRAEGAVADRVLVSVEDLRRQPPAPQVVEVAVGGEIADGAGASTGWVLTSVERELRNETVDTPVPVFGPDASRTLENGAPVFRTRTETKSIAYPILHVKDRCGTERVVHPPSSPSAPVSPR